MSCVGIFDEHTTRRPTGDQPTMHGVSLSEKPKLQAATGLVPVVIDYVPSEKKDFTSV